jgi:hypothetical protein
VSITLVHDFHTKTSTVENISPGVQDMTLIIHDGLVEVETVQVERHRGDTQSGEPDTDNRPCCEEEVQRTGVVEGSVLEDQTTEVPVGSNDVVGLFFLTELVSIVLGLVFGGLTNQRRGNQRTVHCTEQRTAEHASNAEHVEGVHQNVVLCLEDKHVVEGATDTQRHGVRERTLTERIDEEHCTRSSDRSRVCYTDPRTHTETVRQFPLTTHVGIDANQEVEDNELERTTVVEPLIERGCFPDGVEVKTNSVRRRNNGTRDDVVTIHQRTSNGFTDAIDVHRGSTNESDDETDCCSEQRRDHQNTEPTDIETIVSAGYPVTKLFPSVRLLLLLKSRLHCFGLKVRPLGMRWSYYFSDTLSQRYERRIGRPA